MRSCPPPSAASYVLILVFLVLIATFGADPAGAQTGETEETAPPPQEPAAPPEPQPFPTAEISGASEETRAVFTEVENSIDYSDDLARFLERIDGIIENVAAESATTEKYLSATLPERVLLSLQEIWKRKLSALDERQARLSRRVGRYEEDLARLNKYLQRWKATQEAAQREQLPEATIEVIENNLDELAGMGERVLVKRDELLTFQAQVDGLRDQAIGQMDKIAAELKLRADQIIGAEAQPLWIVFSEVPSFDAVLEEIVTVLRAYLSVFEFGEMNWTGFAASRLSILLVLVVLFYYLRNRATFFAASDKTYEATLLILDRPISSALVVFLIGLLLLDKNMPLLVSEFCFMGLLIPILRLAPRLSKKSYRTGIYLLGVLFLLERFIDILPSVSWLERLSLLIQNLVALAAFALFRRRIRRPGHLMSGSSLALSGTAIALALLIVSLIANILGNPSLGNALQRGLLHSTYAAVLLYVLGIVLMSATSVALRTKVAQFSRIVRLHRDELIVGINRVIRLAMMIIWGVVTLEQFKLWQPLAQLLNDVLYTPIQIRKISITLIDVMAFFLAIWASFIVARIIRFVLEKDVLPRLSLDRGVPNTILRVTNYLVLVFGFLTAVNLAGFPLDRLTLLAGAFGVGIGFGLQNIVNNFVSGLVLLFERPIQIGDRVQIGEMLCTVQNIGIRASVVRTVEGAEVIVPNGLLISEPVTNWTLSDANRRIDVLVGVAYGTDPKGVIEVLLATAKEHPKILDTPEPQALFLGFGESSLDFSMRGWTADYLDYFTIRSEMYVAVNQALKDAGYEIPFPQRDLHLRSVDEKASRNMRGAEGGPGGMPT